MTATRQAPSPSTKPAPPRPRRRGRFATLGVVAALCSLPLLEGCAHDPSGTWVADMPAMHAAFRAKLVAIPPNQQAIAQAIGQHILASSEEAEWLLKADGKFQTLMGEFDNRTKSYGTWQIVEDGLTWNQTHVDGKKSEQVQTAVWADGRYTIPGNPVPIILKRRGIDTAKAADEGQ